VNRRLIVALPVAAILASCTAEPPVPSASPSVQSVTSSASEAASPSASSIALDHPPACLDAKLLWADALDRLIMANCVDQFDLASLEMVWSWDGERWEPLSDDGPPATVVTGVGWDPDRDVLVRYGGIPVPQRECITETWEWDTTEWYQVDAEPPDPCDHIEMAWDGEQMILVGGGRAQDLLPGTWSWDGREWSQLTDAGPAPRAHHGMAGALDGRHLAVYGGIDNNQVFDDHWEWNGSAWEELGAAPGDAGSLDPGARSHLGLALGPDGLLLFGGATGTSTFDSLADDTWLEDDSLGWGLAGGEDSPSPRGMPALGYDPDRDLYVLYGGFDADGSPLGDTWEFDLEGGWRCVAGC